MPTIIEKRLMNSVASGSTDTWDSPIVPSGRVLFIREFGGYDPVIGTQPSGEIGLLWGKPGDWNFLRGGGFGTFNHAIRKSLVGTGDYKIRIVRKNNAGVAKPMYVWIDAILK